MRQLVERYKSNQKLKNFFIYGFGQAINIASPLLITPYIIYICGLEKLGGIAIGQSLAYILNVIVDYSSNIIGVKEISINREDRSKIQDVFSSVFLSKTILLIVTLLLLAILILVVPYFQRNALLIALSSSIIIGQAINPTWFLQGIEHFKAITIINIASKVFYIAAVFLLINSTGDYIFANLWLGLGSILANGIAVIWIIQKFDFEINKTAFSEASHILRRDFMFCVSQLFFAIRNYSAVLIVGFFAGDYVAGQFRVVEQIVNLFRTYLQMFFKFSYTYICLAIDKNIATGLQLWRKHNGLNLLFAISLLFFTYIFGEEVLRFFKVEPVLIPKLHKYLSVALLLPLLIGITLPLEQLMFNFNKNKAYIRLTIFSTIFNILGLSIVMHFSENLYYAFMLLIVVESILIIAYLVLLKEQLFTKKPNNE